MYFAKMHGLGNDFIIFNNIEKKNIDWKAAALKSCDRHFGVGADGILIIEKSERADIKMVIINSDGSRAEMCGNGIRCFSKYVYEKGIVKKDNIIIETAAGMMEAKLRIENDIVTGIKINMGSPCFEKDLIPFSSTEDNMKYKIKACGREYDASTLLLGVPHTVIYVDEIDIEEVERSGREIEKLDIFPNKTNVNFVQIINREIIKIRTWERGAGLTLACGTGTCAAVVACHINELTEDSVKAILPGGELHIEYDGKSVTMEGPAEFICDGELFL